MFKFMQYLLLIYVFIALINKHESTAIKFKYEYKIKYIEVPLDHFSFETNQTFQLRYLINDTYIVNNNSPIFFYTGNEGDIELFAKNAGFIWDIAPDFNAMIIFAEHRYYGQSLPFGNKSFDTINNLGYLSSQQALADFADLIQQLNHQGSQRPVILFGGSYGGMLSAWFRIKYPHLVAGAIASSAPILQFTNLTDCNVFSRIVTSVFSTAFTSFCSENIKRTWATLKNFAATPEGRNILNSNFKFCTPFAKPEDEDQFVTFLTDVYGNLAMVNYPYETDFLAPLPAYPVREFCRILSKQYNGTELIEKFQLALSIYTNYTGKTECLNISSAYDNSMGINAWDFQTCTEMVMPMCTNGNNDMFPPETWNFNTYSDKCFKKFGVRPNEMYAITTYGGKRLETASNIIFSNGLLDPWCGGGVLRNPNDKIKIIIIPEGAHHIDLRSANENDPESVKQARTIEIEMIRKWIKTFRNYDY